MNNYEQKEREMQTEFEIAEFDLSKSANVEGFTKESYSEYLSRLGRDFGKQSLPISEQEFDRRELPTKLKRSLLTLKENGNAEQN